MPRFGLITDLHFGDTADGAGISQGDGGGERIYSTAAKRLAEFRKETLKRNVDFRISLGDAVDGGDSDYVTTFGTTAAGFVKDFGDPTAEGIDHWHAKGNHEDANMTTTEWKGAVAPTQNANSVSPDNLWSGSKVYSAYTFEIGGIRFVVVNSQAGDDWDNDPGGADHLTWLEDSLSQAIPNIVFVHQYVRFDGSFGSLSEALCTAIQGVFATHNATYANGQILAVLQSHRHTGYLQRSGQPIIEAGIPHYGLRCSVLGRNISDLTANAFYIFDVSTTGVICRPYSLPHFGRARHTFGLNRSGLDRTRGRSIL